MAQSLTDIEALIKDKRQPPVKDWHPDCEGEMDMVVKLDGSWHHEGSVISREALVRLFASILRIESDGRYCLVTPAEKLFIQVEDAPFIATEVSFFGEYNEKEVDESRAVVFQTNVGDSVIVDEQHAIRVETDAQGNPRPYVHVRDGLGALIARNVYYQLVDACIEHDSSIGFWSRGSFHSLGSAEPGGGDD